ncbi:MAG: hypothetical protein ACTH8X_12110 [Corynebacterium variabile]|jgi:hypothetical protein
MIVDLMAQATDHMDHLTILAQFEDVDPVAPPGEDRYRWLLGIVKWGCMIASICAVLFAGAKFGYEKFFAHGEVQSPKQIGGALVGAVVGSTAFTLMQTAWGW